MSDVKCSDVEWTDVIFVNLNLSEVKWFKVKFLGIKLPCTLGWIILRVLNYIVTICFGYILKCGCFNLSCGCVNLLCNVWVCVCVGFLMCVSFGNVYLYLLCCVLFVLWFLCSSFMHIFSYWFCLYCHRVTTELKVIIIITIIFSDNAA
jgi:hypothetical protein